MEKIRVKASSEYDVLVGRGLIDICGELVGKVIKPCRAALITDDTVDGLYAARVEKSFEKSGFKCIKFVFPHGESSKSFANYEKILEFLAENKFTRSDIIIALGGGVTGDLAGFCAASFLRGVRFVQIPTTFLAAVDSSVGGKTAVNLKAGKNLAGAFHQPALVICDTDTFNTLPEKVFADGVAETVKYGVITYKKLFETMQGNFKADIEKIVAACIKIKAQIVANDEFDTGERMLLNLGHTIGHAIEKCSNFKITHGHAVAIGMAVAAFAAEKEGIAENGTAAEITDTLIKCGLPVTCCYNAAELAESALSDKKRSGGEITLVLPERIGKCCLKKIKTDSLLSFVSEGIEGANKYNA